MNFGVQTLHALLRGWAKRRRDSAAGARDPNGDVGDDVDTLAITSERSVDACGPCDDARAFTRHPDRSPPRSSRAACATRPSRRAWGGSAAVFPWKAGPRPHGRGGGANAGVPGGRRGSCTGADAQGELLISERRMKIPKLHAAGGARCERAPRTSLVLPRARALDPGGASGLEARTTTSPSRTRWRFSATGRSWTRAGAWRRCASTSGGAATTRA